MLHRRKPTICLRTIREEKARAEFIFLQSKLHIGLRPGCRAFFLSLMKCRIQVDERLISKTWCTGQELQGIDKAPEMVEPGVAVVAALVLVSGISGLVLGIRRGRFRVSRTWQLGHREFLTDIASFRIGQERQE